MNIMKNLVFLFYTGISDDLCNASFSMVRSRMITHHR